MAEGRAKALPSVRGFAPRDLAAAAAFCERARALDPAVEPFAERLPALAADPRALSTLWRVAEDASGELSGISFAVLRGPGRRADVYVAVLPALRRRGLGRALLEPSIGWARGAASGPARVPSTLRAAAGDGPGGAPARAFLAALGFAEGPAHLALRRDGAPPDAVPREAAIAPADPSSPADLAALRRLAGQAWEGDPEAFPGTAGADARDPDRLLLFARAGGADPAGYLAARRAGGALVIEEVAVLPEARRQGLGRALVLAALRRSRPRTALLAVAEANRAALRLYLGLGFRPAGRRVVHELRPALSAGADLREGTPVLIVREARPEDDAAVGELLVAGYVSAYARKMPHVVVDDARKRDLRAVADKRRAATVLVAELDGRVVGTVALFRPGAPGSEAWLPEAADLRHLAVEPAQQGRGFSKALLDEAERIARGWGARAVCLHVRRGNEGVARLYRARGYARDPQGDLDYPTVSLAAYALRL